MADNAAHAADFHAHYESEGSYAATLSTLSSVSTSSALPPDWTQFSQCQIDQRRSFAEEDEEEEEEVDDEDFEIFI